VYVRACVCARVHACMRVSHLSVLSVGHDCEPCKTTEPIKVLFGILLTRVGRRTHGLDRGSGSPTGVGTFEGDRCQDFLTRCQAAFTVSTDIGISPHDVKHDVIRQHAI